MLIFFNQQMFQLVASNKAPKTGEKTGRECQYWRGLRTPTNCRATGRSDLLKIREHCNTLHADTIEYDSHQADDPYLELSWQYVF